MRQILIILGFLISICLTFSCSGSAHQGPAEAVDGTDIASMITHDAVMYISDSGVIKYKAITKTWIRYGEEATEPYQYFPDGIHFEQIDSAWEATETIDADTAYNWDNRQLWHLINNVRVTSVKGEKFMTNDLYWDMRSHKVYSDSFIHIERAENIIEGYGFTSTDDFSKYEIRKTNGVFPQRKEQ
ncbi:MAG: LPS export ABC transporter periplasmic protein LptC [Bacteroidales bacterium]|nr:LPS export ABC transporter periplasmic protein LptC [Candidatus Liminaster caballi]